MNEKSYRQASYRRYSKDYQRMKFFMQFSAKSLRHRGTIIAHNCDRLIEQSKETIKFLPQNSRWFLQFEANFWIGSKSTHHVGSSTAHPTSHILISYNVTFESEVLTRRIPGGLQKRAGDDAAACIHVFEAEWLKFTRTYKTSARHSGHRKTIGHRRRLFHDYITAVTSRSSSRTGLRFRRFTLPRNVERLRFREIPSGGTRPRVLSRELTRYVTSPRPQLVIFSLAKRVARTVADTRPDSRRGTEPKLQRFNHGERFSSYRRAEVGRDSIIRAEFSNYRAPHEISQFLRVALGFLDT